MAEKHFRIRIELDYHVQELNWDFALRYSSGRNLSKSSPKDATWVENQIALHQQLLAHPELLKRIVMAIAVDELENPLDLTDQLQTLIDDCDPYDILESALDTFVDEKTLEHFTKAGEKGLFPESSELVMNTFQLELKSLEILEVDEGDTE